MTMAYAKKTCNSNGVYKPTSLRGGPHFYPSSLIPTSLSILFSPFQPMDCICPCHHIQSVHPIDLRHPVLFASDTSSFQPFDFSDNLPLHPTFIIRLLFSALLTTGRRSFNSIWKSPQHPWGCQIRTRPGGRRGRLVDLISADDWCFIWW